MGREVKKIKCEELKKVELKYIIKTNDANKINHCYNIKTTSENGAK